ncbi:FbpB family small basic protein [Virgibacillus phasianinus]|uniref:FbpB family small basic protein n=1 Tax=Virgibacillus phasianinus TaxID=2017483 RepID=A0A220U6H6_9BACI|nr:FbpB family small basic protein [Virgibacillus phasianinus]ASK63655.1 FbpB family small basic protein [Virgibacillus phasianinus]
MRPKTRNFEDLVKQYKQELLTDEKKLSQIEMRLENKQTQKEQKKPRRFSFYD